MDLLCCRQCKCITYGKQGTGKAHETDIPRYTYTPTDDWNLFKIRKTNLGASTGCLPLDLPDSKRLYIVRSEASPLIEDAWYM